MSKIFRTLVQQSDDGALYSVDTIEFEGKLWLVPEWLKGPAEGTETPARIICLYGLPTEKAHAPYQDAADQVLLIPLSKETLAGGTKQGLHVIERPWIILSVGRKSDPAN
jgi:hypothetical protein